MAGESFCGVDEPETKRRRSESNSDDSVPKKEDEAIKLKLSEDIEIQASIKTDGVLKGKASYTIAWLPRRQIFRIQIMCADFKVELDGIKGSIMWAENLVKVFVDKVNAGASFDNPDFISLLAASDGEQHEIFENGFENVGDVLNKATYKIRSLWSNSPSPNIQIMIDADEVLLSGTSKSIMWVGWLIKEVNVAASPSLVDTLFGTVESASGGEVNEHGSSSLDLRGKDALKVDDWTYLVIDRKGGYSL